MRFPGGAAQQSIDSHLRHVEVGPAGAGGSDIPCVSTDVVYDL